MRGLLQFLSNNGSILLFLLLEGISFFMIIRFNDKQQRIATSSANAFIGYTYKKSDDIANYFSLDNQMDDLMEENANLRSQLLQLAKYIENDSLIKDSITVENLGIFLRDTLQVDTVKNTFQFIPANVINNSIVAEDNMLTLDRGKLDEVQPDLGVIGSNGVVGIVRNVSNNYATVMSILHRETRISASIKNKDFFGTLQWQGDNVQYMNLNAIPKHEEIAVNDTVQTSGYSNIFPRGILIGTVEKIDLPPGDNFYTVRVKLSSNMSKLQKAYVVKYKNQAELRALKQQQSQ